LNVVYTKTVGVDFCASLYLKRIIRDSTAILPVCPLHSMTASKRPCIQMTLFVWHQISCWNTYGVTLIWEWTTNKNGVRKIRDFQQIFGDQIRKVFF